MMGIFIRIFYWLGILLLFFSSCRDQQNINDANSKSKIQNLIAQGNRIYENKSGPETFIQSLELYDSAWSLSVLLKDSLLIADAIYAKGRAFDALNNNPQKSIDYYQNAANLYEKFSKDKIKPLYIRHLVAHAYEKAGDSANSILALKLIESKLQNLDSAALMKIKFVPQMALIASTVKNHKYAEELLNKYTNRAHIENDPQTYKYLYSYYLTKANIDVYFKKNKHSAYLDSVKYALAHSENASDSLYFLNELWTLYKKLNDTSQENYYLQQNTILYNKVVSLSKSRMIDQKITDMEETISRLEKQNLMTKSNLRMKFISILGILLVVISALSIYLHKVNRIIKNKQSEIKEKNKDLEKSLRHNVVLNKELEHRVKNNLQIISSLIQMQERGAQPETLKKLQEIRVRIENIGILHTKLTINNEISNFPEYINSIANNILIILSFDKKVKTHLNINLEKVSNHISFPLGLILNEWITNSIKHAIIPDDMLHITIDINKKEDCIEVVYKDNGLELNSVATKSIGTEIVEILCLQLEATLIQENPKNFEYKLMIPLKSA